MTDWTMAQAKRDFSLGVLTNYRIERGPKNYGWNIMIFAGMNSGYLVDARELVRRDFMTLDAVVSCLKNIGFQVDVLAPVSR